jgi:thioesterase domain-containing protein
MAHPRELYSSLNSDYFKVRWGPRFAIDFLKNLPYWLNEFLRLRLARIVFHIQLQLRPAGIFGRIQQKVKLPKTVLAVKEKFEEYGRKLMDEHDQALLDHDNVPRAHDERQEKIAFVHAKAMLNYVMKVYPGHVTVFRTRKQPLFCSFAPDLCWGELAAGGVDVREIDGSTLSILKEPHARVLAEQLKACLDEAQARA